MTDYIFSGRTFQNRATLRDMGAEWHPAEKVWTLRAGGNGMERRLVQLRRAGVKVERGVLGSTEPEAPAAGQLIDITHMSDAALDALLGAA